VKLKLLYLLLCLLPVTAFAGNALSSIYDEQTLRTWKGKYKNLRWNFEKKILATLTPAERRQLGSIRLELPLRAAGDYAGNLLVFYTADSQVILPIQSVKFLDDLVLAWVWYQERAESTQKILDYIAMLKYRKPSELGERHFPPPLVALNVPVDPWKRDKRVDNIALNMLTTGIYWIMAHEAGHLYYRHPGYGQPLSFEQAQLNEISADRFANEIMRRLHIEPLGMANYFLFMAYLSPNRTDFSSEQGWRDYRRRQAAHIPGADRLKLLASELKSSLANYAATEMDIPGSIRRLQKTVNRLYRAANIIEDPDKQRSIATRAQAMDIRSLGGSNSLPGHE